MAQSTISGQAGLSGSSERQGTPPAYLLRVVAALLALSITAVHVADQGGVTAFTSPDWLGWSYRLIEAGGIAAALALLAPRPAWPGWAAGLLLGAGPFLGYLASRTIGVPSDPGDVGNWGDWVGTASLLIEAALIILSASLLLARRQRTSQRS
jgi:hypothetical protein